MAKMLISDLIPILKQPGLMLEMEKEREKLLNFFTYIQPKLTDAQVRAEHDPSLQTWLVDLEAVANDADDIVYDFTNVKLQEETEVKACGNHIGDRVRASLFSCFKIGSIYLPFFNEPTLSSGAMRGIGNRIGSVCSKIDDLVDRMPALNSETTTDAERQRQLIFSSPIGIDPIFVGRDKETKHIVNLINKPQGISIIILGPPGIGKTALALSVCNTARNNKHFEGFEGVLWVEVGSEFNIGKFAKVIIDQIIQKDCCISEDDTDLLELRLYHELMGKRYVLVLDDVWTDDKKLWEKFNLWIGQIHAWRSFVIVTSSFDQVVNMLWIRTDCTLKLEPLMPDSGWDLFCKRAFSDGKCPGILVEIMSKKIIKTCAGSPLAVNMMGCLMRFKEHKEWQGIINQLEEYIGDGVATVEKIITLCYDNLCSQAKQCFAFCSLFPKGYYIEKEVLIKLWMANGLLFHSDGSTSAEDGSASAEDGSASAEDGLTSSKDGSMSAEEKGNIVFNELALKNFFGDVKIVPEEHSNNNKHEYHSRVTCKMLDLIREQAIISSREFAVQIPHLISVHGDPHVNIPMLLENYPTVSNLLFPDDPFIRTVNCSAVPQTNSLRGLHLRCALFERNILDLKNMRHLRYLDLSRSRIKTLPEVTSLLYFLQTLNLSKCLLLYQLPENMKYMKSLRHLYVNKCPKLKKMPTHFGQLTNLQTLTTYIVGENAGTSIDEIKGLHLSGLVELYNLHKVKSLAIAREADLYSKKNLDRLTLCWGSEQLVMRKENNDLAVLEALQPHNGLKVLKIKQYGGHEFGTWLANPGVDGLKDLVELHLIGCSQLKTLPAVWKLLSLRVLCLKHMPSLTCISHIDEKDSSELFFQSLKRLVLIGLKRLERWNKGGATCSNLITTFEEVTFPKLDELEITGCPNLKTMPHVPQLKHITASVENYSLLQSVTNLITHKGSIVEEVNIAKACNADNEPFPTLGAEVMAHVNHNIRIMRMDSLPHSVLDPWRPFKSLQHLDILNCNTLEFWPTEFTYLSSLMRLSIQMCPNLTGRLLSAQAKEYPMSALRKLEFYGCSSLKQVPMCPRLDVLELDECPQVESVAGIKAIELKMLYLSCTSWTSLPSGLRTLGMVGTLWVSECYSLTSLSDELAYIGAVETLVINKCPMMKDLPINLKKTISCLRKILISECPDLEKFCKEEPYSEIISDINSRDPASYRDSLLASARSYRYRT